MAYNINVSKFIEWLDAWRNKRNLSLRELARQSGLSPATVANVMNGYPVTWDFCAAMARITGEPPERLFRLAGLLPDDIWIEEDITIKQILDSVKRMTPAQRRAYRMYGLWLAEQAPADDRDATATGKHTS